MTISSGQPEGAARKAAQQAHKLRRSRRTRQLAVTRTKRNKPLMNQGLATFSPTFTEIVNKHSAERTGFEPAEGFDPFTDLANRRFRPLSHLSGIGVLPCFRA